MLNKENSGAHHVNIRFTTERLSIETVNDVTTIPNDIIVAMLTDNVTRYLPDGWQGVTESPEDMKRIQEKLKRGVLCSITTLDHPELCGFFFLFDYHADADNNDVKIGYLFTEKVWGRGYASEVVAAFINCFKTLGNVSSATGNVVTDNVASAKVLTKNGFKPASTENDVVSYVYTF